MSVSGRRSTKLVRCLRFWTTSDHAGSGWAVGQRADTVPSTTTPAAPSPHTTGLGHNSTALFRGGKSLTIGVRIGPVSDRIISTRSRCERTEGHRNETKHTAHKDIASVATTPIGDQTGDGIAVPAEQPTRERNATGTKRFECEGTGGFWTSPLPLPLKVSLTSYMSHTISQPDTLLPVRTFCQSPSQADNG